MSTRPKAGMDLAGLHFWSGKSAPDKAPEYLLHALFEVAPRLRHEEYCYLCTGNSFVNIGCGGCRLFLVQRHDWLDQWLLMVPDSSKSPEMLQTLRADKYEYKQSSLDTGS